MLNSNTQYLFKLLQPIEGTRYKVGTEFDSFGGLVSGVNGIPFRDKKYFKLIEKKIK